MKILRQAQDRLIRQVGLLIFVLVGGCSQDHISSAPEPMPAAQAGPAFGTSRPKPGDIIEFNAEPVDKGAHFRDFKIERKELEDILRTWHQVPQAHWQHGYSHVAFGDRTGIIRLKDGATVKWMVKPGGLAKLTFQNGTAMYLARELTPWENEELKLSCSMARMEFTVGDELTPPEVKIHNSTSSDVNLIGPTITVIDCTLVQPDKKKIPMCLAMPTGRDPRQMPPRKLKAQTAIELTAEGIWYYEQTSGFRHYVFRQVGNYEFWCEYEHLNSNIITITVGKDTEQATPETLVDEKLGKAYAFLIKKIQEDDINLIASEDNKNLDLLQKVIHTDKLSLVVENYKDVEQGPDLCYYSKSTKQLVAIINVTKRNEKIYYVSYYLGPEGGASKEIQIEKRNGKWTVVNDDGMWNVK